MSNNKTAFRFLPAMLATAIALGSLPASSAPSPIAGRWLTENKEGVIDIAPCGADFCGRIVGMTPAINADGSVPRDVHGTAKCNLQILADTRETAPGKWEGMITDPDHGSAYHCELTVDAQGKLHLRGYVLMPLLGQTQIWTPYAGQLTPACAMG